MSEGSGAGRQIGRSLPRVEDARLLAGRGRFVDDLHLPAMAEMAILRSPFGHARVRAIDLAAARALPGVVEAFAADDLGPEMPSIPIRLAPFPGFERFLQTPLAAGTARYAGEPVAVVVARDRYVAEDALARIEIDYEPLPAVTDALAAAKDGDRLATTYAVGRGDIDAAFAAAEYTRRETFRTNRQAPLPMETRGLIADFDDAAGRLRLWGATKVTYFNRGHLAEAFGLSETDVELIEVDVGGGFGVRGELYPEDYLVPIASRRAGRPVKWIEDRHEHLMASNHSRDVICELEIAATRAGEILGLRGALTGDLGAYVRTNGGVVPSRAAQFLPGPYRIPAVACDVRAVMTNKTPVGTYRGPGRFEANFFRERLLDMMAADLGLDPVALRRENLLRPDELPFPIGELVPGDRNTAYDAGDFRAALETALAAIGHDGWGGGADARGRRLGLGVACFVESSAAGRPETARVSAAADGRVEVRVGASSLGQGLETGMTQICAEALGIDPARIDVRHGTTTLLPTGGGTFHSRNTVMAGNAVRVAAEALRERCMAVAALRWNTDARDLSFADGAVRRGEETLSLAALASYAATLSGADADAPLAADGSFDNRGLVSFSYGAHAAIVAVDVETGGVEVVRYVVVEEIGRALNPMMVHGQAVGGAAQGLGGALFDRVIHDGDGQLMTATLADYLVPLSTDVPEIAAITLEDFPSRTNPMGFKGAGEGGIVAVGAAIANAVADALPEIGRRLTELPVAPAALRRLMEGV